MQQWREKIHQRWRKTVDNERTVGWFHRKRLSSGMDKWALALMLGLGAGYVGPFGTYVFVPLFHRLIYWTVIMLVSFSLWRMIDLTGQRVIRNWPYEWSEAVVMVPFAMANSTALVIVHWVSNQTLGSRFPISWTSFFMSHVLMTSLVVAPTIFIVKRLIRNVSADAGADAIDFLTEKLPPALRGVRPFALAAEGHYVRVYTDAGEDLVTLTFEGAMRSVQGIPGFQTHRSWWVSVDAMKKIRAAGSAYELELESGLIAPVGRRRYKAIKNVLPEEIKKGLT